MRTLIRGVKLVNWKSHENTELEFEEGTNVLVGIMGSGKSAVLDAITYGLFGTVPAVRERTITLDDLIMKRPVEKDSAEVEVRFVGSDDQEYVVKRVLERGEGTTYAELRRSGGDGELVNKPRSTEVSEDVASILRVDYDFFERMIYAEQNQLDRFLTLSPRKRRQKVDEILKINKFENARKKATTLINRLDSIRGDKVEEVEDLRQDEDIDSLSSLEDDLESTKSEKVDLKEKKEGIKPELEELKSELESFDEVREDIEELRRDIESVNGRIDSLNDQIEKLEENLTSEILSGEEGLEGKKVEIEDELEELEERKNSLDDDFRELTGEKSRLETECEGLKEDISSLESEIEGKEEKKEELDQIDFEDVEENLEKWKEDLEEKKESLSKSKAKLENVLESLEELKEAESTCPVCDRSLQESLKSELIQERKDEKRELEDDISSFQDDIRELEGKISDGEEVLEKAEELESEVKDLVSLKEELSKKRDELDSKESDLEDIEDEEEDIGKEIEESKEELEKLRDRHQEVKEKISELEKLEESKETRETFLTKRKKLQNSLDEKNEDYDEERVEKIKEKRDDLLKKQERFKTRLSEIQKLIEEKEKRVEDLRGKKRRLEKLEKKVERLDQSLKSMKKLKKAFSQTQTSLRKQIIEAVNGMMNDIWDDVYPYDDFQRIRLSIEEKRDISDYELQLMDSSGNWNSVEGMMSGGERTSAVLTLRISFSVVLSPGISWLVLDEPTHNLDSEAIDTLSEVLRERVPRIVKQLILITHERGLESAGNGALYRFNRDKDTDQPTRVERIHEE